MASGSRQYSENAVGVRSSSSPTSPSGTIDPSSDRMDSSMGPRGLPTVWRASSSSASKAVAVPQPPDSVEE